MQLQTRRPRVIIVATTYRWFRLDVRLHEKVTGQL
jgi:hypothetical protein